MSNQKITNLGIAFRCSGDPLALVELAQAAENAGFSGIWLVEVSDVDTLCVAGALAAVTKKIKIATGVANSNQRLPTFLAMGAVTASELTRGRFILGVGAGSPPMGYQSENRLNTPLIRLEETIRIVRGCLSTGKSPFDFSGRLFSVKSFRITIPSNYSIPIYSAAMGPRMVELAGKVSDGVVLMLPTIDYVKGILPVIDREISKRGLRRSQEDYPIACYLVTVISDDPQEALETARLTLLNYVGLDAYRNNFVRLGFGKEVSAIENQLRTGVSREKVAESIPDEMIKKLIVFGNAEECAAKIMEYVNAGVTHPVIYPSSAGPLPYPERIKSQIEKLGPLLKKYF